LAEFDAVSTDRLAHAQDSAARFGEGSTRVNLLKGMPAFHKAVTVMGNIAGRLPAEIAQVPLDGQAA
jgi:hypothetical protein